MIRLVPNTGVQFVRLPDLARKELESHAFQARRGASFAAFVPASGSGRAASRDLDDLDAPEGGPRFRARTADMTVISRLLSAKPEGAWLPVPFEGGGVWASVFLKRIAGEREDAIQCMLAVDTMLDSDGNPDGLGCDELGERMPSPCAPRFWRQPAVELALNAIAADLGADRPASAVEELQVAIAGLADLLARKGTARVYMERRPQRDQEVAVDMVVDLGNSRTCVLLDENLPDGRRERLELLYPDEPFRTTPSPFETQSAFFDHRILPRAAEGTVSFRLLSMVKLGPGALDALARSNRDPRPLGISTPKRYLWEDFGKVEWEWRYSNRVDERNASPSIAGDLLLRMDPRRPFETPAIPSIASPDHPRVACMVWTFVELFEQAFRQVNSPEWRRTASNAPRSDARRVLANVVVTYPAGLHTVELDNLRRSAEYAARLWSEFRTSPERFCSGAEVEADPEHGLPAPKVQMICDEGIAIQLCWLYGESMHRFGADAELLVSSLGRSREGRDVLRLASIDIGGGTVDLAIADYSAVPGMRTATAFRCERLFHDSISRAGDDVLRGILERSVFPAIVKRSGCAPERWNRVFAASSAPADDVRELRRQLVRTVWVPVAMRALALLERASSASVRLKVRDACSSTRILDRLASVLGLPGGDAIGDVEVELDATTMRTVVRQSIGKTINQCADIIDQFDCDLLVVGGRPSGNPAIRDQIYAAMAVPPGQVVFLSELAVDDWYPFSDGSGRIGDAKTCGVVGGSIAFRARYAMGGFVVEMPERTEPQAIVGYLRDLNPANPPAFPDSQVLSFAPDASPITFMPMNPLVLANRRVDDPMAEARPIYQLRLKSTVREALLRQPGVQKPVSARFELLPPEPVAPAALGDLLRPSPRHDVVQVREGSVQGTVPRPKPGGAMQEVEAARCLELRACTLLDAEGYWIDTGVFKAVEQTA
jgi:hypothetical protein